MNIASVRIETLSDHSKVSQVSLCEGDNEVAVIAANSNAEAHNIADAINDGAAYAQAVAQKPCVCPVCEDAACETKSAECGK